MRNQEFLAGFVKSAEEHGLSEAEAHQLLHNVPEEHKSKILAHLKRNAGKYVGGTIGAGLTALTGNPLLGLPLMGAGNYFDENREIQQARREAKLRH